MDIVVRLRGHQLDRPKVTYTPETVKLGILYESDQPLPYPNVGPRTVKCLTFPLNNKSLDRQAQRSSTWGSEVCWCCMSSLPCELKCHRGHESFPSYAGKSPATGLQLQTSASARHPCQQAAIGAWTLASSLSRSHRQSTTESVSLPAESHTNISAQTCNSASGRPTPHILCS